jgi:hypothetical protein
LTQESNAPELQEAYSLQGLVAVVAVVATPEPWQDQPILRCLAAPRSQPRHCVVDVKRLIVEAHEVQQAKRHLARRPEQPSLYILPRFGPKV